MSFVQTKLNYLQEFYFSHYPPFIDQTWVWVGAWVLAVLGATWLFTLMVRGVGVFLGGTYVPVDQAKDQGTPLDEQMNGLALWLTKTLTDLSKNIQTEVQENIAKHVEQLSTDLMKEQAGVLAVFQKPTPSLNLRTFIGEEENRVGDLVLTVHRRVSRLARRTDLAAAFRERLTQSVDAIVRVAPPHYVVVHTNENLKFEEGDSLTIKIAKVLRRGHRWVERRLSWLSQPLSLGEREWPVRVRKIPWQSILQARLGNDLPLSIRQGLTRTNGMAHKVQEVLRESARVVQFNLESASAELKEDAQGSIPPSALTSARATAEGGMDRVVTRLKTLLDEMAQEHKQIEADLVSQAENVLQRIRKDIDVADTVGAIVTQKMENFVLASQERWSRMKKRSRIAVSLLGRQWVKWREKLSQARAHLGLKPSDTQLWLDSLDGATVSQPLAKVPPLYRRVFRFEPLDDEDFFVSRDESLEVLKSARDRWQQGFPSSIGIFGPVGSGKTSLILCGQQRFFSDVPFHFITLKDIQDDIPGLFQFLTEALKLSKLPKEPTLGDISQALQEQIGKAVVVLEGANLLFSRRIGGFEALDAFIHLMSATRPEILWVVSLGETAWKYLDRVRSFSRHFSYTINARNMDREDLERVMTVRHEITGYDLVFVAPDGFIPKKVSSWKKPTSEKDTQPNIRNRFFQDLKEASDGNTYSALFYWLSSVDFSDDKQVLVHPLKPLDTGVIRMLSPLHRMTLLATLQHGIMTPLLYSKIFRSTLSHGEILLRELSDKKLLLETPLGRYQPNPILVPAIIKVLREGNLIYD
jgi:hypothetical protein